MRQEGFETLVMKKLMFALLALLILLFAGACTKQAPDVEPDSPAIESSPAFITAAVPESAEESASEPETRPVTGLDPEVESELETDPIFANRSYRFFSVDGMPILFHAYETDEHILLDLFEVASVLSGTTKQFLPEWNEHDETPHLTICSNSSVYELDLTYEITGTRVATPVEIDASFDGTPVILSAFSIDDHIYFCVDEVADVLNLVVCHEPAEGKVDIFTSQMLASVIKRETEIDPLLPMVALTFDDGPGEYTGLVLDILDQYNVVATFYVIGKQVERYSETVLRAFDAGHEIANHTWSHWSLDNVSAEGIRKQLHDTNAVIESVTGVTPSSIRPPFGRSSSQVRSISGELDLAVIFWSVDPSDYLPRSVDRIYDYIMDSVRDRDIILLHDVYERSVEATRRLVPSLINSGYQLVTVSELMYYSGITLNPGSSYSHAR